MLLAIKLLTLSCLVLTLVSCSSLSFKPSQAQIIESVRTNISISPKISHHATSVLLAAGHTQESCMMDFENCLKDVQAGIFDDTITKSKLALFAELHYAHAAFTKNQESCQSPRPPINAYYANAPLDVHTQKIQQKLHQSCIQNYIDALYQTINHSYAYLFFDALTDSFNTHAIVHEDDIKS